MAATDVESMGSEFCRIGLDRQDCISEWCSATADLTGFLEDEVSGMKLSQLLECDDLDVMASALADCRAGKKAVSVQFPFYSKDGLRIVLQSCLQADDRGRALTLIGRKVQDEVRRASKVIYIGVSKSGHVTDWNEAAAEISGYERAEVLKAQIGIILEDGCAPAATHAINVAASRFSPVPFSCYFYEKCGKRRDVILNASARRDPSGEVLGIDITDSNHMELVREDDISTCGVLTYDSLPALRDDEADEEADEDSDDDFEEE